jgi:hypothetical protein
MVVGTPLHEPVAFSSSTPTTATYTVTFTESGLPNGATWYVNLTGQSGLSGTVSGSTGTLLTISLSNGSYSYAGATNWKNWTTTGGSFPVSGAGKDVSVDFTAVSRGPANPSNASAAGGFPWLWVVVGVVVAVLLLIGLVAYRRRKKENAPPPPSMAAPPIPPV